MSQFAIFVTIKLKPGTADAFRPLIEENAEAAAQGEPDCLRLDVLRGEVVPVTFFFFEVYTNAEGLEKHRESPHYQKYNAATEDMIEDRAIQRCELLATNG